jgi:hypothetical protein
MHKSALAFIPVLPHTLFEFTIGFASLHPCSALPVSPVVFETAVTPDTRVVSRPFGAAAALVGGEWFDYGSWGADNENTNRQKQQGY